VPLLFRLAQTFRHHRASVIQKHTRSFHQLLKTASQLAHLDNTRISAKAQSAGGCADANGELFLNAKSGKTEQKISVQDSWILLWDQSFLFEPFFEVSNHSSTYY
jgi:hypothetical protein